MSKAGAMKMSIDLRFCVFCWIAIVFCLCYIPRSLGFQCERCDPSRCPGVEDCPGGWTLDPCHCCKVCARVANQTCQGRFGLEGHCDTDLVCSVVPEFGDKITGHEKGTCKAMSDAQGANCDDVTCEADSLSLECPGDSVSLPGVLAQGKCCPEEARCQCLPCAPVNLTCGDGQVEVFKTQGNDQPGNCCDSYICKEKDDWCVGVTGVICDKEGDSSDLEECPPDSQRLPPLLTHNGCCQKPQGCECKLRATCELPECSEGTQPWIVKPATGLPGECCDLVLCVNISTLTCQHGDEERLHGEIWELDHCTTCSCKGGLTFCSVAKCDPPANCGWMGVPDGECCLTCRGCVSESGGLYRNGESWDEDSCVSCQCDEGQVYCQAQMCSITCAHPRKVPGQCCPVCDDDWQVKQAPGCPSVQNCSLHCAGGLVQDDRGCYVCQCKATQESCELECPHGYKEDSEGHPLCQCQTSNLLPAVLCQPLEACNKECAYGFKVNKHGCPRCRCNKCPPFLCKKKCPTGYVYNSKGCKLCKCTDISNLPPEPLPTKRPVDIGRRCMSVQGRIMEEGQSWHDGCRRCFCHQGREMCALITCPVPRCHNPVIKVGDCCPTCGDEDDALSTSESTKCLARDGSHLVEGESWTLDECTQCICHEGGILCEIESCPPVLCHHPIKLPNRCCPVCPDGNALFPPRPGQLTNKHCTSSSGTLYDDGDTWRVNSCQSCLCHNSQIHCFSQTCPLLTCNKTILKKGQCCPYCLDTAIAHPKMCHHEGSEYSAGESWLIGDCTKCICHEGQAMCTDITCEHISCPHPVRVPGVCCPVCDANMTPALNDRSRNRAGDMSSPNDSHHKNTEVQPQEAESKNYRVTVGVLVAMVTLLGMMVIVLLILLMRTRRRGAMADSKNCNATQTYIYEEVKKRPKSTNLDLQGINPLLSDYDKVQVSDPINHKVPFSDKCNRYSAGDERTAKVMALDIPDVCDTNNYRKSL